jgi:hypothetical protein
VAVDAQKMRYGRGCILFSWRPPPPAAIEPGSWARRAAIQQTPIKRRRIHGLGGEGAPGPKFRGNVLRSGPALPRDKFSDAMETSDTWKNCQPREITAPSLEVVRSRIIERRQHFVVALCAARSFTAIIPSAQYRRRFPPAVLADKNGVHFHVAHSLDHNELLADRITFSRGRQHDAGVTACNHADTARPTSGRPAELV